MNDYCLLHVIVEYVWYIYTPMFMTLFSYNRVVQLRVPTQTELENLCTGKNERVKNSELYYKSLFYFTVSLQRLIEDAEMNNTDFFL